MARFRTVTDYFVSVKSHIAQSHYSYDWNAVKLNSESKIRGIVQAVPFHFIDGAILRFFEEVVLLDEGNIHRPSYSYHYECVENGSQFFFRYDRDPLHVVPIVHEECHLHANRQTPRFKTHAASFSEVFDFILASFYDLKPRET
jgi:hypothetical protein